MNILIVEDELLIARVYSIHLKNAGYNVIGMFTNENDTLQFLQTSPDPDLIIMDVQLKNGGDGIALTKEIKRTRDIPVIITSGNPRSKIQEQLGDLNNIKLLTKPVDPGTLLREINEMLS